MSTLYGVKRADICILGIRPIYGNVLTSITRINMVLLKNGDHGNLSTMKHVIINKMQRREKNI